MIETLRTVAPGLPRGIVAERHYTHDGKAIPPADQRRLAHLLHAHRTRPHFIAYHVKDLPMAAPLIARMLFGLPLLTWTVRTEDDRLRARRWADQMIFEGWRP
jgi:glycerophosphoryl diester phosphodiesterase